MMLRALLDRLRGQHPSRAPAAQDAPRSAAWEHAARTPCAYAFTFNGTLEELHQRLCEVAPWDWQLRESTWYGDYLRAWGGPEGSRIRVYEDEPEPGSYTIEIPWPGADGPQEDWEAAVALAVRHILPGIGATDVRPTASID